MSLKKLISLFRHGNLWSFDDSCWQLPTRIFVHAVRRLVLSVELFLNRNLSAHAAALTYSSILGAVPILAIVFAIARGFGFGQLIEEKLKANVNFSPEVTETIMNFVNSYLERARGGVFIGVGLVMLFYTLYSLTSNIETAFNRIWQVRTSRNIYRSAINYISVFFLLPIVIIITSGLQIFLSGIGSFLPAFTFVSHGIQLLVQLSPYALAVLAFILLYKMMPNTEVEWRSTFIPGLIAGTAFQGLQWGYINSQMWLSSYNAVYGSFAAIPLFMLFIQLSWNICLFGAGISFVRQHETELADQKRAPMTQQQTRQQLADETLDRIHDLISQYRRQEEVI